jgi:hypothetical protein
VDKVVQSRLFGSHQLVDVFGAGRDRGLQIGGATYQNVSGFGGPSHGREISGGIWLIVGWGYASNSSGMATCANISIAGDKNFDVNTNAVSNGNLVIPICKE